MSKNFFIIVSIFVFSIAISYGLFYQNHLKIWDHTFAKSDIKNIIFYSKDQIYNSTNHKDVINIAEELSRMERESKIEVANFPPDGASRKNYIKILIQTKNNTTYGGSIFSIGDRMMLVSNGYYWSFNYRNLSKKLKVAQFSAKVLN